MVADARAHERKEVRGRYRDKRDDGERRDFVGSFSGYEHNPFFLNGDGKAFIEAGHAFGLDTNEDGRAVAPLDIDGDGDQDLVMLSMQGLRLLRNDGARGRKWLKVRLRPAGGNAYALGAIVKVVAGATQRVDRVRLTAGFHTQVSNEMHFGLGAASNANVEVRWPSGKVETFLALSGRVDITEGEGAQPRQQPAWATEHQPRIDQPYDLTIELPSVSGPAAPLALKGDARFTVVNFWAPWCKGCDREMPELRRFSESRQDVAVVGVSLETKDRGSVAAFIAKHGGGKQLLANDRVINSFFGARAEVVLPSTFVFDAAGRLRRSFRRTISSEELESVLRISTETAEEHRRNGETLLSDGKRKEGIAALERAMVLDPRNATARWRLGTVFLEGGEALVAIQHLRNAVKLSPGDPEIWADLAAAYRLTGNRAQYAKSVRTAVKVGESARAYYYYGFFLRAEGDMEGAERAFKAAIAIDPTLYKVYQADRQDGPTP